MSAVDQADLFGSIHELVEAKGAQEAVTSAGGIAARLEDTDPGRASLIRTVAGRNGRRIADTAAASIIRDVEQDFEIGYTYSAWCLAGLPHREHPPGEDWLIGTDYAQLLVRPGVRVMDNGTREHLSVPVGTLARLILIDWQTEAFEKGSREIVMGRNPNVLLKRLGLSRGGPVSRKIADQLERLARCAIDFKFGSDREAVIVNERLVEAFQYVTEDDPRTKRPVRMIERVVLSEAFYRELRRHPIPIDRSAIKDIQSSPRAIDIYLWLAFRLHALKNETVVSWPALWRQFGREKHLKTFKDEFKEPLALALAAYRAAKVQVVEKGLSLSPSPPPVKF
ncbi:replication protein RepA [Roseomonas sp. GC11]|uniref:replication protein RepA n=1 Tax=Roseomonas sp. GC11 TaxID=2950546 RepID=UPI00210E57C4|nr:replication protein RepA [Roseomonas sp. GC11]MCQ4158691.1 replication protein RepA [Roseomonas sp. GC11]